MTKSQQMLCLNKWNGAKRAQMPRYGQARQPLFLFVTNIGGVALEYVKNC